MNASELKYQVESAGHAPHFFTRSAMKFFGDRMANYGVRSAVIDTCTQKGVQVWELYRKRAVRHGLDASAYFDKETLARRHEVKA